MNLEDLPDLIESAFAGVVEIAVWDGEKGWSGSGFLVGLDEDEPGESSLVMTNAHVAGDIGELVVFFRDGTRQDAQRIGAHPLIDLAIVQLDEPRPSPISLRGEGEHRLGEFLVALGHPGPFSWTATSGLLSGLDRPERGLTTGVPITMIQTDADVNPGNSGGPLIGLDGKAVGITTSGSINHEVLFKAGFAIPAHSARLAAETILRFEGADHIPRAWTGIPVRNQSWKAPPDLADSLGIKGGLPVVEEPKEDSPAGVAGLREADIVVSIDEKVVDDAGDLFTWMLEPDCLEREVTITFLREGDLETTQLLAVDQPVTGE